MLRFLIEVDYNKTIAQKLLEGRYELGDSIDNPFLGSMTAAKGGVVYSYQNQEVMDGLKCAWFYGFTLDRIFDFGVLYKNEP